MHGLNDALFPFEVPAPAPSVAGGFGGALPLVLGFPWVFGFWVSLGEFGILRSLQNVLSNNLIFPVHI